MPTQSNAAFTECACGHKAWEEDGERLIQCDRCGDSHCSKCIRRVQEEDYNSAFICNVCEPCYQEVHVELLARRTKAALVRMTTI